MDGVRVPPGFCVTTRAYRDTVTADPAVVALLADLSRLRPDQENEIRAGSAALRAAVAVIPLPDDLTSAVDRALARIGADAAYAVRSSATVEDSPTASFAGQQDSYLNVVGPAAVLRHISLCWASLFTERAVVYRMRNGMDHRTVGMAVVVQRMVDADAAGVLFTADPVSGNRTIATVEAVPGLGEALVSGRVNPDVATVRKGDLASRAIVGERPVLTDDQVLRLVHLGRAIEAHFGAPQDIEWCLQDNDFQIVQSRPITTLFPLPAVDDDDPHVYISVGHQQMMTDAMTPLGLSIWQQTSIARMQHAGGRLFVDAAGPLSSPAGRVRLLDTAFRSDPLVQDALRAVLESGFLPLRPEPARADADESAASPSPPAPIDNDPGVVTALIDRSRASIEQLRQSISSVSGAALFDFLPTAFAEHRRMLSDPQSMRAIMAGMDAAWWLTDHLLEWLDDCDAVDVLTRSVPGNVTSEMGLALLDVADVIRGHPAVVAYLQDADDDFLQALPGIDGGLQAAEAIAGFLERYGMRCVGEIDITRPRWSERPSGLLPILLGNVAHFPPGEARRRFDRGLEQAKAKEAEVLQRLRALPDGAARAAQTHWMIDRVRTFAGYREYPKYAVIRRYFLYKQALMREANALAAAGVITAAEDVFFLTFDEFAAAVRTGRVETSVINRRRQEFAFFWTLRPPRVLTSDGEVFMGGYRRPEPPAGALPGLPVSTGVVEGRARVILDIAEAAVEPGDILVTTSTDPSWSPLFVAVAALVTEVGGQMTHGAVIAREYGLPAVVGVEGATTLIRDGQRIRVDGSGGYVEILADARPRERKD